MPVDFVAASYISAFLPGAVEKAWGDLCGPPSIGKTELLRAFEDGNRRTIAIDNLTENAFASAFRDENDPDDDKSLTWQLCKRREPQGPKVLILKDLSTFMKMRKDKVSKFFSDLRSAFEGSYSNVAGNIGLDTKSDLQFGLLTSCTEAADEFRKEDQSLGQRTFVCRMGRHLSTYKAHQALAISSVGTNRIAKSELRSRIQATTSNAISKAIKRIRETGGVVTRSKAIEEKVGRLAAVCTRIRTVPLSDKSFSTYSEGPSRMAKQLESWIDCRVLFDDRSEWTNEDYDLVRRIAQDTMPPDNLRAMCILWRGSLKASLKPMSADMFRSKCKLSDGYWRQLHQWNLIDILVEHDDQAYSLNPEFARDIERTRFMEGL